jgi:UDP-N-acetylmuramoylalanine-D-glutamate ligase
MLDSNTVELVIAFPGGKGTSDMVSRAKKSGIEVKEIQNE